MVAESPAPGGRVRCAARASAAVTGASNRRHELLRSLAPRIGRWCTERAVGSARMLRRGGDAAAIAVAADRHGHRGRRATVSAPRSIPKRSLLNSGGPSARTPQPSTPTRTSLLQKTEFRISLDDPAHLTGQCNALSSGWLHSGLTFGDAAHLRPLLPFLLPAHIQTAPREFSWGPFGLVAGAGFEPATSGL